MKTCYSETMVLPKNCMVMDEEEMCYVEGGDSCTLEYSSKMRNKLGCISAAKNAIKMHSIKNLGVSDAAAEIYAHALLYYNRAIFAAGLGAMGLSHVDPSKFNSILDGINLEDKKDDRIISGVYYYQIYNFMYSWGPAFF